MFTFQEKVFLCLCITLSLFKSVYSINCYQCSGTDSNNPFQCNEFLENDVDLVPTDCATIHDAQYCIKHVGRFEGIAIECYQCNSSSTMECGDGLMNLDGGILKPTSCKHVYNALYCIKQTGLLILLQRLRLACNIYYTTCQRTPFDEFTALGTSGCSLTWCKCSIIFGRASGPRDGGISTKRFCSSLDLGNYCNYVQQPGDKLEYRTCIYTCSSDGCNAATSLKTSILGLILAFIIKCFV